MSRLAMLLAACLTVLARPVDAQILGTFAWQTQPFCTVITLTVVQQGGVYQVAGSDNLCGAGTAPVTGTITPGGPGLTMGLTIVYPTGRAAQVSAGIRLSDISGPWSDADGNAGTFAFAQATGGGARPAPAAASAITTTQLSPSVYGGTGSAATVARSDHTHDDRYFTETEVTSLLAGKAAVGEVYSLGNSVLYSLVAEDSAYQRTVTTSAAGRLDIRYSVAVGWGCTPNTDAFRAMYITVDGVAVPSSILTRSAFVVSGSWQYTGVVTGITTAVIPAGAHVVRLAAECSGADVANLSSVATTFGLTVAVVH